MKKFKEYLDYLVEMAYNELGFIERYANNIWKDVNVRINVSSGHFFDRVNDARNGRPIEKQEVKDLFKRAHDKYGKEIAEMHPGQEFVIFDHLNNINIPFIVDMNHKITTKTIMRKKNFLTHSKKFKV